VNTELITILIGFTVVYAWTFFVAGADLWRLHRECAKLRQEVSVAVHSIAIRKAAEEGDFETARLMAAVHRDMVKSKPPVALSAGAKEKTEEEQETGIRITQG